MIFVTFNTKKTEHLVANSVRWDERQWLKVAQEERARRNVQEADDEADNNRTAACEGIAKQMLKYSEDSEAMKVSTRELKEQVLSPDESTVKKVRIARQARSEKSKTMFQIFRQGANEVLIASVEQLRGLVVLERDCLALRKDEQAEDSTRRLSVADLPGTKRGTC